MPNLRRQKPSHVPLWLKAATTVFTAFLIVIYYQAYGPAHFLWLSDIALFVTVIALWRESRLLNSMMVIGILPLELIWNFDFFVQLLTPLEPVGLASYMFDSQRSLLLRSLSLFHIALPLIWLWLFSRLGYDCRALKCQLGLFWLVIGATLLITDPSDNVNWIYGGRDDTLSWTPEPLYVLLYVSLLPALVFWPAHRLAIRAAKF
jgi:hypothetical protein